MVKIGGMTKMFGVINLGYQVYQYNLPSIVVLLLV